MNRRFSLTNYCTATPPALASFGVIARHKCLEGCVGFLLPVKARAGRVNRGVRPHLSIKDFYHGKERKGDQDV